MKLVFAHNLRARDTEEEAEFDSPETVAAIASALERAGHEVELLDVSGPLPSWTARLAALRPELVFSTAEGRGGRGREALFPAVFEAMDLPYTGGDAVALGLTLDKALTKAVVEKRGVRTPRAVRVVAGELDEVRAAVRALRLPVILKPNAEGSSKGIGPDAVVREGAELMPRVEASAAKWGEILVEEYIEGRDLAAAWIEGVGVLPPIAYTTGRAIYDYALKNEDSDAVSVAVAELDPEVLADIEEMTAKVVEACGLRDLGRADYRLDADGNAWFLEVNALPSLEPGAGIYLAAARRGLESPEALLGAVVESAARRQGIGSAARPAGARVALTFNLKRSGDEAEAEFDAPETVAALEEALRSLGHQVFPLEATSRLPALLERARPDVVFNIAEGIGGRGREGQVPALCELLGLEHTASDAATLTLTLDKAAARHVVEAAGIPVPRGQVMNTGKEKLAAGMKFPVVVKPAYEGSSKGITESSLAQDEAALRTEARALIARFRGPVLVEEFLSGREFTLGVLVRGKKVEVLPPMEVKFAEGVKLYGFEEKKTGTNRVAFDCPADVDEKLGRGLERLARRAFKALGCRDVARVDVRLDSEGRPRFLECNPLPGLSPGWSDLCVIAERAGMSYPELIDRILRPALDRKRTA